MIFPPPHMYILHYWAIQRISIARVNALCNLSRKKSREVAAHFRADFWVGVASRCVLYTVEVEPRIAKQYKCQYCCSCKNYRGKGMEGGKKSVFASFFWLTRRSRVRRKKMRFGASYSTSNELLLMPDTFWLRASKNVFKVGSVKFANSLSPPTSVKKVRTGRKSSQGT